jgi:hypothetical protein
MRYFAYCTLLDTAEMRKFCPTAKPAMVARLSGYQKRSLMNSIGSPASIAASMSASDSP